MKTSNTLSLAAPSISMPTTAWFPSIASLQRGLIYLLVLALPVCFFPSPIEPFAFPKQILLESVAILLFTLAIPQWLTGKLRFDRITIGTLIALSGVLLATGLSTQPGRSWNGQTGSDLGARTVLALGIVFIVSRQSLSNLHWSTTKNCLFTSGMIVSIYALIQISGCDPFTWSEMSKVGTYIRPFSTLAHANHLAAFLLLLIPITVVHFRNATTHRWLFGSLLLLFTTVLLDTLSRGAILALLLAAVMYPVWQRSSVLLRSGMLLLGVCCFLGLLLNLSQLQSIVPNEGRIFHWQMALSLIQESPWFGHGWERFGQEATLFRSPELWQLEPDRTPVNAHNVLLQWLSTAGVLGLFTLFVFSCTCVSYWRKISTPGFAKGIGFALVAYVLHLQCSFLDVSSAVIAVVFLAMIVPSVTSTELKSDLPVWCRGLAVALGILLIGLIEFPRWQQYQQTIHAEMGWVENHLTEASPDNLPYQLFLAQQYDAIASAEQVKPLLLAEKLLHAATQTDPQDGQIWANWARVTYRLNGPSEEALKRYEAALSREPNHPRILAEAAETAIQLKQLDRSATWIARLRQLYPNAGSGYMLQIEQLWQQQLGDEALAFSDEMLAASWHGEPENFHRACQRLGQLWLAKQYWKGAVEFAGGFQKNWPNDPVFYRIEAIGWERQREWKNAQEAYAKALKLDPNHEPTRQAWTRITDLVRKLSTLNRE